MNYRVLCITDRSDLPETELFIGLKHAGVDIEVICNPTGKHYQRLVDSSVPAMDLILKSRFDLSGIRRIRQQLHAKSYDILYCFNNPAASNTLIASSNMKFKIITYRGTIGNLSFLSPASWTTHLHPRVNRIVCVSNAVRKYLINMKLSRLKLQPEAVVTIYKGHDIAWYQNPPADLTQFNIPQNAFVVGFSGRNRPHKGVNFLLDSAKWLPKDAPIHFILMGELKTDMQLRRQAEKSPFHDRIHFAGYRNDAPAVAAACDTFVMPSTKREGLSRAVIEAMSCATPPIVTTVGGLPEIVVHQESGLVVPPKNPDAIAAAIMDLYNNPEKRKKMGEQAQQRIQRQFNIKTTIAQTKQLFEQLLAGS
jgi:glycosyltransferase involved in cell wall biosynthesis